MPGLVPAMTAGQAFIPGIVTGSCARSSRNSLAAQAKTLLPGDRIELFQPILHRLAEVIAATAERRSAFLDKVALLSAPAPRDGCRIPRWRPAALVSVDPVQPLQPLAHRLLQVVVRPAESGIAARDEFLLLAPQGARLARSHRFTGRPDI